MCRTVTLIIEFKLLNRMEKVYRLIITATFADFESIYRNNPYIEIFDISKFSILNRAIRYDTIYGYRNAISIFSIYRPISTPNLHRRCIWRGWTNWWFDLFFGSQGSKYKNQQAINEEAFLACWASQTVGCLYILRLPSLPRFCRHMIYCVPVYETVLSW